MTRRSNGAGLASELPELQDEETPAVRKVTSNTCKCGRARAAGKLFCENCLPQYAKLWAPITGPAKFGPVREGD